jgi:hypothetical protein
VILMADRSGVRLEGDVTMEGERESFSNRRADRKILLETTCSARHRPARFSRWGVKSRLV